MTDILHSVREGRLLRLTLNRPEKRNALDAALCRALVTALDEAAADPAISAILLTGNGKTFCAGMDLAEIEQAVVPTSARRNRRHPRTALHRRRPAHQTPHRRRSRRGPRRRDRAGGELPHRRRLPRVHLRSDRNSPRPLAFPYIPCRRGRFGPAANPGTLPHRADLPRSRGARTRPGSRSSGGCRGRALEIARTVAGFSPTAIQEGIGFVLQTRGLDSPCRRRHRPRGAEPRLSRRGFPRGPARLSGETSAPLAVQRRRYLVATRYLWICDTTRCGVAIRDTLGWVEVLYFSAERV